MIQNDIITFLFQYAPEIRYVALYIDNEVTSKQKESIANSSTSNSDHYEEILVNPVLLKLSSQRGNIDCGGLRHVIIAYGNFNQLIREVRGGHISICLEKSVNLTTLPEQIFNDLKKKFPSLL